ncbi:MAG: YeeE/YedE thiosulfate transporter family protein [Bacteroidota bacterium]|nr:YeeE/YedE thiosulfate transporter family protein [Bacteroidota bacterium]
MSEQKLSVRRLLPYLLVGIYFGIVFSKSEVISWFRIQEMFRFQAFHMYGIIGSAVVVAMVSVQFIRKKGVKTFGGEDIVIPPKQMGSGTRYWLGGTIFGLGWALTGSCPGPMYALIGNGYLIMLLALASAFAGTYVYGMLRPRLPH